jgi:hypothetical protein
VIWFVHQQNYKTQVLNQPTLLDGSLKHIEWDGWGFVGTGETHQPTEKLKSRFDALTSLRFFASVYVLAFHVRNTVPARHSGALSWRIFIEHGYLLFRSSSSFPSSCLLAPTATAGQKAV